MSESHHPENVNRIRYSTHSDWNPRRVDLLTTAGIVRHFKIPLAELDKWITFDVAFPEYRRAPCGTKLWRLSDINEYVDGQRL